MTRTYRKNVLRTFKSARSRFAAIFSIVALGVGFLAGLNATPIDMKESMEQYMDDGNFYDLRIVSTLGLTDDDVAALEQVEGVKAVQPAYSADLFVEVGEDVIVSRAQSLPPEGDDAINRLVLTEGRMPQTSGECVVEAGDTLSGGAYPVGTKLTVSSENEDLDTKLDCTEYTVVGVVRNANYCSFEREPASVGNGSVELVMYLRPEDFAYESYTEIYVTAEGALEQDSMGDDYDATVERVKDEVEAIQDQRCQARYDEILADAQAEIDDAWTEYYDAEAEAQQELADAAQELADGRQELADGEQEYYDGEKEYADGVQELADNEAKVNDGAVQLEEGRQELMDNQAQLEEGEAELAANEPKLAEALRELQDGQAEYDAGLQKYNDALAQIEEGEQQLAEGKAKLDAAEQAYTAGLEEMARQLNEQIEGILPGFSFEVSADQIEDFVLWFTEKGYDAPGSYDELLDRFEEYLQEKYGLPGIQLPLSAARRIQAEAQKMLESLGETPPEDPATTESALAAVQPQAEELPAQETLPAEETAPGTEQPPVEEDTLPEEVATPETAQLPQAGANGTTAAEPMAMTLMAETQKPMFVYLSAESDSPQAAESQTSETQLAELKAQLTAILENDRSDMQATLQTAQAWVDAQPQPLEGAVAEFAAKLPQWQAMVAAEQQQEELQLLVYGVAEMVDGRRELDAGWAEYDANAQKLADGRKQLEDSAVQLSDAKKQLDDGWAQYREGLAEYEAGKKKLEDGRAQLNEGWATLTDKQLELDDARRQINDAKAELADARAELDDARATIAENAQKLRDGEIEYEDAKTDAEKELADARAEIEDGEKELADIEMPEWYVWDRNNNVSYASFTGNVEKLSAITTIFPIFFFLVAALVVSTTMTRMVEEERLQIGTLKALGYTRGEIMQKYLWYALVAAVSGTVVGLTIGFKAFPSIIWSAYAMMYYMPAIYTPWRLTQALFAGGTLTALTIGVTAIACRNSLTEVPATLMLPRAPKAGKRILLERITPLWRRFPFTWKVTCRNLLRYQKRFWMTVIGVAGCTSLLVAGFGISDSLNAIITKQFDDVSHYDLMTIVTDPVATESGPVYDYLFQGDQFSESMTVSMETTRQESPDGEIDVYLMIPQDVSRFADFLDLHERISRTPTPLGEEGVVLTEKLAKTLGVAAGDTITLENSDGDTGTFTVTGVCEHYISNYVYMSAATYAAGFGRDAEYNAVLSKMVDDSDEAHDTVSSELLAMDNVASLTFTQDSIVQVLNMLNSIDSVVVLIIVCAACLAFVVLYNLSNINIAERVKEIATIKVLGFYDREVYAYVNRENVLLTLIGTLFGVVGGIALHRFIIVTVEVDAVMFGRDIQLLSFVYAIALTLLFSTIVNLVMGRLLKKISMVESMKAPE